VICYKSKAILISSLSLGVQFLIAELSLELRVVLVLNFNSFGFERD
jgi:hypothetical protein